MHQKPANATKQGFLLPPESSLTVDLVPEPNLIQQPLTFSEQRLHTDQIQVSLSWGFGLIAQQKSLGLLI